MKEWTGIDRADIRLLLIVNKYGPCSLSRLEFLSGNIGDAIRHRMHALRFNTYVKTTKIRGQECWIITGRGLSVVYFHDFLQTAVKTIYTTRLVNFKNLEIVQRIGSRKDCCHDDQGMS